MTTISKGFCTSGVGAERGLWDAQPWLPRGLLAQFLRVRKGEKSENLEELPHYPITPFFFLNLPVTFRQLLEGQN